MMTEADAQEMGWGDDAADFAVFMNAVDIHITRLSGLTHHDLTDHDYANAFLGGESSLEVAREVLANNNFPFE